MKEISGIYNIYIYLYIHIERDRYNKQHDPSLNESIKNPMVQ